MTEAINSLQDDKLHARVEKLVITITVCPETSLAGNMVRDHLMDAGFTVQVFQANGSGGRAMEQMILQGKVAGVIDLTTSELVNQRVGGITGAGIDRLTAAAIRGIPQVISLGALDIVNIDATRTRRSTAVELDATGKEIVEKASAARGPTRILVPLKGLSSLDTIGAINHDPTANEALFQSLRNWVYPPELLVEREEHINDASFAVAAVDLLVHLMATQR